MHHSRGFDMSPALLNAASWWTKYLELKPSIRLAVHHTMRETVWAWTDASGEDPCLGVVVHARRRWYYTYLVAPPAVLDQLLHRQDSQINFLEMLGCPPLRYNVSGHHLRHCGLCVH